MNTNFLKVAAITVLPLLPTLAHADTTIIYDRSVHYNNNSTNYNDNRYSGGGTYPLYGTSAGYADEPSAPRYYGTPVIVAVPRFFPAPMFRGGPFFRPQFGGRPMYRPY